VKLALDPQMFYSSHPVFELPDIAASLGYDWMELSPKADFIPFFRYGHCGLPVQQQDP
jgi:myo-inositol catabolism protein IolH